MRTKLDLEDLMISGTALRCSTYLVLLCLTVTVCVCLCTFRCICLAMGLRVREIFCVSPEVPLKKAVNYSPRENKTLSSTLWRRHVLVVAIFCHLLPLLQSPSMVSVLQVPFI